jgi:serine/threonine-protein kinase
VSGPTKQQQAATASVNAADGACGAPQLDELPLSEQFEPLRVSDSDRPLASGLRPPPRRSRRPFSSRRPERIEFGLPLSVGSLLDGRYRILDVLGAGGMGTLLLGRNEALDVEVAIKVLRPDTPEDCDVAASHRLVQEARAAARLGHPAIVRVFDFGVTEQGNAFLVMERLDGTDLGTELEARGSVPPVKAVRCLLPVAHGLAAAHDKGIVHRDVKPENIFLARTDAGRVQPKLIDFGVAKIEPRSAEEQVAAVGGLVGSPGYMAPEQALGQDSSPHADVWSLCVVLYEMVTGRPPFEGDSYNALMRAILEREPVPLDHHLPEEAALSAIVARGLAKAPLDRWPSMRALGEALASWLLERGVTEDLSGQAVDTTWLAQVAVSRRFDAFASLPPPSPLRTQAERSGGLWPTAAEEAHGPLAAAPAAARRPAVPPPPLVPSDDLESAPREPAPAIPGPAPVMHEAVLPGHDEPPSSQHRSAPPEAPTVRPGDLARQAAELAALAPPTMLSAELAPALDDPVEGPTTARSATDRAPARRAGTPWLVLGMLLAIILGVIALWTLG